MSALMAVERMMSSTHQALKLMLKQSSLFDDYSDYSLKAKDSPLQSSYLRSSKLQHVDILKDVFNRSEALMDHSDIITDGAPGRFLDDQSLRVEAAMAAAAVSLPPATAPQHSFALVPLNESVMAYRERSLIDVSLFNGRRFRVGWAPGRAHFSIVGSGQEKIRSGSDIQLTANFAQQSEQQASYFIDLFEHNVQLSTVEARKGFCPRVALPAEGVELLHAFEATASQCFRKGYEEVAVWRLAVALWGALADCSFP
uniref:Uncharacterized protein n=1 Tax=Plectus sambesii TaxID=2011161 RepID=A0A914VBZ2_9BILA